MKTLQNYIEVEQTKILEKYGVFFAFSNKQFEEQRADGVDYVALPSGTICPKENVKEFLEAVDKNYKECIAKDIAENGLENIIERELCNHECYYTGNTEPCVDALSDYEGITEELVMKVFQTNIVNHLDD